MCFQRAQGRGFLLFFFSVKYLNSLCLFLTVNVIELKPVLMCCVSREHKVEVLDRSFQPMILLIEQGDRVWWHWDRIRVSQLRLQVKSGQSV